LKAIPDKTDPVPVAVGDDSIRKPGCSVNRIHIEGGVPPYWLSVAII